MRPKRRFNFTQLNPEATNLYLLIGPANEFNKKVVLLSSRAQFYELLDAYRKWRLQFLDENGQLKPAYHPPPMVASFMQEPEVARRKEIPVPKGPVEVW